jgi:hypothetical protein
MPIKFAETDAGITKSTGLSNFLTCGQGFYDGFRGFNDGKAPTGSGEGVLVAVWLLVDEQ